MAIYNSRGIPAVGIYDSEDSVSVLTSDQVNQMIYESEIRQLKLLSDAVKSILDAISRIPQSSANDMSISNEQKTTASK